jgi:hypothetical protein
MTTLRAFAINWDSAQNIVIMAAESRNKAKSSAAKSLKEVGYAYSWLEGLAQIKSCKRAPEYDEWAAQQKPFTSREKKALVSMERSQQTRSEDKENVRLFRGRDRH